MFALKQAIGVLVLPATLALLLVAASGVLALRGRARAATYTFLCGALLAYLGAIPLVGNALLAPLERQYAAPAAGEHAPPNFVVVLGSGYLLFFAR